MDQQKKYKRWIFTWNADNDNNLLRTKTLRDILEAYTVTYAFQLEKCTRFHFQGCFELSIRRRKSTVLKDIEKLLQDKYDPEMQNRTVQNLTIENMNGSLEEAVAYATKLDSRVDAPVYSSNIRPYTPSDLDLIVNNEGTYTWQKDLLWMLTGDRDFHPRFYIEPADDRSIVVIVDVWGNSGKSKFVKTLCFYNPQEIIKLPFGTAQQLRSSVISAGAKKVYFLDLPRTLGTSDNVDDIISTVEDIKNGFITTSMYGKHQQLMMLPPHIVIFTNKDIPQHLMSMDRWSVYDIGVLKNLENRKRKLQNLNYHD